MNNVSLKFSSFFLKFTGANRNRAAALKENPMPNIAKTIRNVIFKNHALALKKKKKYSRIEKEIAGIITETLKLQGTAIHLDETSRNCTLDNACFYVKVSLKYSRGTIQILTREVLISERISASFTEEVFRRIDKERQGRIMQIDNSIVTRIESITQRMHHRISGI